MPRKHPSNEYDIHLKLANDVNLSILLFGNDHRWIFEHKYDSAVGREKPILINDTRLVVEYQEGVASECKLEMNVKRLDREGRKYFLGVDISPGSLLVAEFVYEKQGELFRMKTIDLGSHGRKDLDELGNTLAKTSDFPFPLEDRLDSIHGEYKVPFLKNDGEKAFFTFPATYVR